MDSLPGSKATSLWASDTSGELEPKQERHQGDHVIAPLAGQYAAETAYERCQRLVFQRQQHLEDMALQESQHHERLMVERRRNREKIAIMMAMVAVLIVMRS